MTVDYPTAGAVSGLRELWKEAFGDSDLFLDAFFAHGFSLRRCRCVTENGAVLAALYWFEVTCGESRLAYLYAVATAASHRGKGLFSTLLADTKEVLKEAGFDGILLVPENEALGRMYERFGFESCTTVDTFSVKAGANAIDLREIGADEFARLRKAFLPQGAVIQEGAALAFLSSQCHFWTGPDFLAVGQVYDGKLVCMEFLGNRMAAEGLLRALETAEGTFRSPGEQQPLAWLLPLHTGCARPEYFGLALD